VCETCFNCSDEVVKTYGQRCYEKAENKIGSNRIVFALKERVTGLEDQMNMNSSSHGGKSKLEELLRSRLTSIIFRIDFYQLLSFETFHCALRFYRLFLLPVYVGNMVPLPAFII
jgi:hypothetical protein